VAVKVFKSDWMSDFQEAATGSEAASQNPVSETDQRAVVEVTLPDFTHPFPGQPVPLERAFFTLRPLS